MGISTRPMRELSLFSGAGGGLLATKWLLGFRVICYVENNPYRIEVLKARIRDGYLDDAPIWDDIKTFNGTPWRGCVDVVTAGFPCQPFSTAGKQQGEDDKRNLWPETIRVIREARPAIAFLENVPGLVSSGYIFTVLNDLAESGYEAFPPVRLAASDVGANHKRKRIWIVAYSESQREVSIQQQGSWHGIKQGCQDVAHAADPGRKGGFPAQGQEIQRSKSDGSAGQLGRPGTEMAHTLPERCPGGQSISQAARQARSLFAEGDNPWAIEPELGRVAHGVANRVDRVEAIGDGQVPAVVSAVWKLLMETT